MQYSADDTCLCSVLMQLSSWLSNVCVYQEVQLLCNMFYPQVLKNWNSYIADHDIDYITASDEWVSEWVNIVS